MWRSSKHSDDLLHFESGEYLVRDSISSDYEFGDYIEAVVSDCKRKYDNVTLITAAREGLGKSVLAQSLALHTQKAHRYGTWDWRLNTVFYDWEAFSGRYTDPTPYLAIVVDEAIEMLFSRMSSVAAQKRMVQDIITGRFMSKHAFLCGPNLLWFDPVIRSHKAHYWIHLVNNDNPETRRAYILRRHRGEWPSRSVIWEALGYVEYPLPVPDWFVRDYEAAKVAAFAAYREKLASGVRKRRERGPCDECGLDGPLNAFEGRKLCWRCKRRAQGQRRALGPITQEIRPRT